MTALDEAMVVSALDEAMVVSACGEAMVLPACDEVAVVPVLDEVALTLPLDDAAIEGERDGATVAQSPDDVAVVRERSDVTVVRTDWLVDELWATCGEKVRAAVAPDHAGLARDVFAWLLLAEPEMCPLGARRAPERARLLTAIADDPRVRALRTLTVGDEEACADWVPSVVASLFETGVKAEATPAAPPEERATSASAPTTWALAGAREGAGDLVDDVGAHSARGTSTRDPETATDDDAVAALLDIDDRATLRRLIAACHRGLQTHDGFAADPCPAPSDLTRTRDPARVAADVWQGLGARETEALLWRDWTGMGLRGTPAARSARRAPVVVLCDESGSMQLMLDAVHTRRTWALATVLATADLATVARRDLVYIGFAGDGACWRCDVPAGDTPTARSALTRICAHAFGGGTAFEAPIQTALDVLRSTRERGARVLVVSDGEGAFDDPGLASSWRAAVSASGARCWGVRIGGDDETPLEALCDTVARLEDFAQADLGARYPSLMRTATAKG